MVGYGIPIILFTFYGFYTLGFIPLLLSSVWLIPKLRKEIVLQRIALGGGVISNVIAMWLNLPIYEILISTTFILGLWEFSQFNDFIKLASKEDTIRNIVQRHLIISLLFFSFVIFVTIGALSLKLKTTFSQAVILVILVFAGLIQLLRWMISTSDR
jgi:hypothetical protein